MTKDNSTPEDGALPSGPKYMSKADDVRPKPKRFYKEVTLEVEGESHKILLDGRVIKTPMKETLAVKTEALAKAIQGEWAGQGEEIDSETMILTKLANTGIDRVAPRRADILAELVSYGGNDLLCYRATEPNSLVELERKVWDPVLNWFSDQHDIRMQLAAGVIHVAQEAIELEKLEALYDQFDEFALTALHNMTTMLGSALLPLALILGDWEHEEVWSAAHLEEDFQIQRWGQDEQAQNRREIRHGEFLETYKFYQLSRKS